MAAYGGKPNFRTRMLGRKLKEARLARGLTADEVKDLSGIGQTMVYRHESGHTPVKAAMIEFYAQTYQPGADVVEEWRKWARLARQGKGAWAASGSIVGPTYLDYADAEGLADNLSTFQPQVIPGLLQTTDYSRHVIRASTIGQPTDDLESLRERRKAVLTRSGHDVKPLRLWAIIGEAAILTPVGDMREQLGHLVTLIDDGVGIQILPFSAGAHPGLAGAFSILSYGTDDVLFREGYGDGAFNDDPAHVREYRDRYAQLQALALSMKETRQYLEKALNDL